MIFSQIPYFSILYSVLPSILASFSCCRPVHLWVQVVIPLVMSCYVKIACFFSKATSDRQIGPTHRAGSEPASNPHLCHCGAATPRLFRFSIGASSLGSPWNLSVSADAQELLELRAMSQTDAIHHYCGSTHGQQAHVWHPVASDT